MKILGIGGIPRVLDEGPARPGNEESIPSAARSGRARAAIAFSRAWRPRYHFRAPIKLVWTLFTSLCPPELKDNKEPRPSPSIQVPMTSWPPGLFTPLTITIRIRQPMVRWPRSRFQARRRAGQGNRLRRGSPQQLLAAYRLVQRLCTGQRRRYLAPQQRHDPGWSACRRKRARSQSGPFGSRVLAGSFNRLGFARFELRQSCRR